MGNFNFRDDLTRAKETERQIAEVMEDKGWQILGFGDTNIGDIKGRHADTGEIAFIECKEDFGKNKQGEWTDNVALEFMSRGKPSGILVGQSKYWVYKIHHRDGIQILAFKREKLISLIEKRKYKFISNGGDKNSNTMLFVFPLDELLKIGKEIWRNYP